MHPWTGDGLRIHRFQPDVLDPSDVRLGLKPRGWTTHGHPARGTQSMLRTRETPPTWPDTAKLLAWLAVGLLVAMRTFRWERAA